MHKNHLKTICQLTEVQENKRSVAHYQNTIRAKNFAKEETILHFKRGF